MSEDGQRMAQYAWDLQTEVNRYPELTDDVTTVPKHFRDCVAQALERHPEKPALVQNELSWDYSQYLEAVEKTALAFINLGLEPLQGVGMIGFNAPEWIFSFFASMFAGGFAVGIYSTNNANACAHVIKDAACPIIVTQDKKQTDKVLSKITELTSVKALVQYEGSVEDSREKHVDKADRLKILSWAEMMEQYAADYTPKPEKVTEREATISPYRCATLVYTSGTTGNPKGAILTHANYMSMLHCVVRSGKDCWAKNPNVKIITYLPLSHIMAQVTDIGTTFSLGGTCVFAKPDALKGSLAATIAEHRPTVLIGVPRVYEKIQAGVEQTLMKQYGLVRWSIRKCLDKVLLANECAMAGIPEPWGTYTARGVVAQLKRKIGLDEVAYSISGGAPLLEDTQRFWLKLDMPICQGYGLSEVSGAHVAQYPIMTSEDLTNFEVGSAGILLDPKYKVKIDPETHEVLLAGQNVFSGYLNREQETKDCLVEIDGEIFFKTGDMGRLSAKGQLYITGRLKELIITAGGENVPPVPIEEAIKANCEDLISNVLVVGDKRKFLACFVTLKCNFRSDENGVEWPTDTLTNWSHRCLERQGITGITTVPEAKDDERIRKLVEDAIKTYNETEATSNAQKVQKFEILDKDFSIADGDLGPTLKLKRNVVVEKFKEEIDKFYPED